MKFDFNNYMETKYKNDSNYKSIRESMNSEKNFIGNDILAKRISKGLSQKSMAKYLGISLDNYIMIESGTTVLPISILNSYLNN